MTETPATPAATGDGRNDAKLTHIINGFFPLGGGLIFWLINKDKSTFADSQGKEAVNFGINVSLALIASWIIYTIISIVTFGIGALIMWILPLGVWVYAIIMGFKAGGEAEKGIEYRYPICPLRLVK